MLILKLWKVWLPFVVLGLLASQLLSWRADFANKAVESYTTQINNQAEVAIENAKQEVIEAFRNGTSIVVGADIIAGMLKREGVVPESDRTTSETNSDNSSGLQLGRRDTPHADKLNRGSPEVGDYYGLTTEQEEFLKGNTTIFNTTGE